MNVRLGATPWTSVLISPLAQDIVAADVLPPVALFDTVMVLAVKLVIVVPAGKLLPDRRGAPSLAKEVLATEVMTFDPVVTIPEVRVMPIISFANAAMTPDPILLLIGDDVLVVAPPKLIQPLVLASRVV
jgi:hypothetical protein